MLGKIMKLLKDPKLLWLTLDQRGFFRWMRDEKNIRIKYWIRMGKKLDLENPKGFNEKLQWIKLYDRKPEYTMMADKFRVREFITEKLGAEYLVPLLGMWEDPEDIDFDMLPEQFVLKCNHDSGSVVICKDKNSFNKTAAVKKLKKSLKRNGFWYGREWPYKNIKPCVIAEAYMVDESGVELKDYKVLCFNGEPKMIEIHQGRFENHTQDFYNTQWDRFHMTQGTPMAKTAMKKPVFLEEMLRLSRIVAKEIPHVRVDWYYVEGQLYFGEMTFFDGSGFIAFSPESWDETLGSWIRLPAVTK